VVGFQLSDEPQPGQRSPKRRVIPHWLQAHRMGVLVESELDLVAGGDAQPITQIFRDHDLPFRTDPMSHTRQYNFLRVLRLIQGGRNRIDIRVRSAMATQARSEGRFLGGRPPYGYRLRMLGRTPTQARLPTASGCIGSNRTRRRRRS
jgi:hypothetical protein